MQTNDKTVSRHFVTIAIGGMTLYATLIGLTAIFDTVV